MLEIPSNYLGGGEMRKGTETAPCPVEIGGTPIIQSNDLATTDTCRSPAQPTL